MELGIAFSSGSGCYIIKQAAHRFGNDAVNEAYHEIDNKKSLRA